MEVTEKAKLLEAIIRAIEDESIDRDLTDQDVRFLQICVRARNHFESLDGVDSNADVEW
jgi:hypothetical protein